MGKDGIPDLFIFKLNHRTVSHDYARVVECLKFVLHAQGAESYQMSNCLFKRCTVHNNKVIMRSQTCV